MRTISYGYKFRIKESKNTRTKVLAEQAQVEKKTKEYMQDAKEKEENRLLEMSWSESFDKKEDVLLKFVAHQYYIPIFILAFLIALSKGYSRASQGR